MNKLISIIFITILVVSGYFFFGSNNEQGKPTELAVNSEVVSVVSNRQKSEETDKVQNGLINLTKFPSDEQLVVNWEEEFECFDECLYEINPNSPEDALWFKKRGYLTNSMIENMRDMSPKYLEKEVYNGNQNAAKFLSLTSLEENDSKSAKNWSLHAMSSSPVNDTFNYRLRADAHLLAGEPMLASVELRKAILLGDTTVLDQYTELVSASNPSLIDGFNEIAYNYLSSQLNGLPASEWNQDPRPDPFGG